MHYFFRYIIDQFYLILILAENFFELINPNLNYELNINSDSDSDSDSETKSDFISNFDYKKLKLV
jgi:hypothetical protein